MGMQDNSAKAGFAGSPLVLKFVLVVALCSGLAASFVLSLSIRAWDRTRFQNAFGRECQQVVSALKQEMDTHLVLLDALRGFYDSSENVNRREFASFVRGLLTRYRGLQGLEWIPRVPEGERKGYEESARREGFSIFQFTERNNRGELIRAAAREEYYPVYYVEPYTGNEGALGFDLASDPVRKRALDWCRDTGTVIATPFIGLVQERGTQKGFLAAMPVYNKSAAEDSVEWRRENLAGFYVAVFQVGDFVTRVLEPYDFPGIELYLFDQSLPRAERLVFFRSFPESRTSSPITRDESGLRTGIHYTADLVVGQRHWSLVLTPSSEWREIGRTWLPWAVLAAGALFTALMTTYLVQVQRGAQRARRHLAEQAEAKEALEQEVMRRETAEKILRESEKRYRTLFESATDAILILEADGENAGRIRAVNPAAAEMHGYTVEEMLEMHISDLDTPESAKRIPERMARLRKGECLREEVVHRRRDGSLLRMEINARLIELEGRNYFLAIDRDISERKAQEEALTRSNSQQRAILDNIPDIAWLKDTESRFIAVNEPFANACGIAREALPGKNDVDVWPRELAERYRADDREVMRSRTRTRLEEPFADQEGRIQWIETIKTPVLDDNGNVIGTTGIARDITERRQTQQKLLESERKFRLLYEAAPVAYQSLDRNGRLLEVNDAWLKALGYSHEEVIGTWFGDYMSPSYAELFRERFFRFRTQGAIEGVEFELVRKDGSRISVELSGTVALDPNGKFRQTHCVFQDVTERRRADKIIREQHEFLKGLLESVTNPFYVIDASDHSLVMANSAARDVFAREGSKCCQLTHAACEPCNTSEHPCPLEIVKRTKEPTTVQHVHFDKEGRPRNIEIFAYPVLDEQANVRYMIEYVVDVTQRKQAEAERTRLMTAIEQAAETVIITDSDGTIVYANPAFERISGYSREEVIGKNPRILRSGEHDDRFYSDMWRTLARGDVWKGHFINRRKDGTACEEEATISPVKDASGSIVNFVAVKRDVTGEVLLQKQLFQAQKMEAIGTLAGGVAHDFNNLLQIVLGYSDLTLLDGGFPSAYRDDLEKIKQAARSGAELVQRLLTFSRKTEFKPLPLDLNQRIVLVHKLLTRTLPRMIQTDLVLCDNLPKINADPTQMEQVLMNLAVNARDAMPDGGRLLIETSTVSIDAEYAKTHLGAKTGQYVRLSVSDTGKGIDEDTAEHIFEPFYTTKGPGEGTGLGLAMVYGIVRQHEGYITCSSETGKGTTFTIYFPATQSPAPSDRTLSRSVPAGGTETILLTDDEEIVRDLGARMLSKAG